jgi:uncharacterized repeat protein (TIGR03847 family)
MPRRIFLFDPPDRFVSGTIGEPGNRTFFLQARKGPAVVSVSLEKSQVAVLAERMGTLLLALQQRGVTLPDEPMASDAAPLDEPLNEQFRVGTLTLTWEGDSERIMVEARELTGDEDEDDDEDDDEVSADDSDENGPDVVRVRIPLASARGFVRRAMELVAAGRPPCPICGEPLNPEGHLCPRRNGYLN